MQIVTEHISVEVGNVGRPEGWLHQGALRTPSKSCASDVNVFLPLNKVMFPKEPLMHTAVAGRWDRWEELCLCSDASSSSLGLMGRRRLMSDWLQITMR